MTTSLSLQTDGVGRRFEMVSLLGEGGFGEVYLCRMTSPGGLEQAVAVKLLHQGLDPESQAVERLRDEARTLASLRHPVLLAALDLVELSGRVALVTEFVEGQDLSSCVHGPDRMPMGPLLEVIAQVAGALDAAWQQLRVVHRDIKPANIRVGLHGNVKLLDFGIARSALGDRAAKTEAAMLVGTLRYMAPERFETDQTPLPASDVFALGCVLYEGLTDEALFAQKTLTEVCRLAMVPERWMGFVEQRLAGLTLPEGLMVLLRETLAHDTAARPTAGELVRRCEDLVGEIAGQVHLSRWCRERSWPPSPLSQDNLAQTRAEGTRWQLATPAVPTPAPSPACSDSLLVPVEPTRVSGVWLAKRAAATAAVFGTLLTGVVAVLLVAGIALTAGFLSGSEETHEGEIVVVAPAPEPVADPEPVAEPEPTEPPAVQPRAKPAPRPVPEIEAPAPAVASHPVALSSIPGGAEIRLVRSGEVLGTTPLVAPLPAGEVTVRMTLPDGTSVERTLVVGKNAPTRYVWRVAEGRVDAGY